MQVIGPFEVNQQFHAKSDFKCNSNFTLLRQGFQKLLLEKLGDARAASTFPGVKPSVQRGNPLFVSHNQYMEGYTKGGKVCSRKCVDVEGGSPSIND